MRRFLQEQHVNLQFIYLMRILVYNSGKTYIQEARA